jgi:hypothetical protein
VPIEEEEELYILLKIFPNVISPNILRRDEISPVSFIT